METLMSFRLNKGKSMQEMSEVLDLTLSYYAKIERGDRNPSYNFLCKFKKAFPQSSIDKIFFEF